jgi:uncharacterized Tic20 family protein
MTNMPQKENTPSAQEPIRIPVDVPKSNVQGEPAPDVEVESLIREYERRYKGTDNLNDKSPGDSSAGPARVFMEKLKNQPAMRVGLSTENERLWAALAYASALLTMLIGIPTGGLSIVITLFIPLMIYFYYRQHSEYIAYHAIQAFALQVIGTVGWVAILVTGMIAGGLLCVILGITIVGIILIPFVVLAMILFAVASLILPLGMVVFSVIAAWESYQGKWYRVPYIGLWLEKQMQGGFLTHV